MARKFKRSSRRRSGAMKRKRSFRKKSYRKRNRRNNHQVTIPQGMPDRMYTTGRWYGESTQNTLAAGSLVVYTIQSSVFDPATWATGQPHFRDQFAALYKYYRVHSVFIEWNIMNVTKNGPVDLVSLNTGDNTVPITFSGFVQQPGSRVVNMGLEGKNHRVRTRLIPARAMGMTRRSYNYDETTRALVTADPSRMAYNHLCILNRGTAGQFINIQAKATFKVEYFDPLVVVDT